MHLDNLQEQLVLDVSCSFVPVKSAQALLQVLHVNNQSSGTPRRLASKQVGFARDHGLLVNSALDQPVELTINV
jgi:hypothetical protein